MNINLEPIKLLLLSQVSIYWVFPLLYGGSSPAVPVNHHSHLVVLNLKTLYPCKNSSWTYCLLFDVYFQGNLISLDSRKLIVFWRKRFLFIQCHWLYGAEKESWTAIYFDDSSTEQSAPDVFRRIFFSFLAVRPERVLVIFKSFPQILFFPDENSRKKNYKVSAVSQMQGVFFLSRFFFVVIKCYRVLLKILCQCFVRIRIFNKWK